MFWFGVMHLCSTLLDWLRIGRLSEQEKDLEILLLRQQLAIVDRKLSKPLRISRVERIMLAVTAVKWKAVANRTVVQMGEVIRMFKPETVIEWHYSRLSSCGLTFSAPMYFLDPLALYSLQVPQQFFGFIPISSFRVLEETYKALETHTVRFFVLREISIHIL